MPKPLLAPAGRPLLDLALDALEAAGAAGTVVNAHHHAGAIAGHLADRPGCRVLVEPELLGTGGGVGQARRLGLLGAGVLLLTCADVVVDPADLGRLGELVRAGAPAAVGLVPAGRQGLPFALAGGLVRPREPGERGGWASAGVYALAGEAIDRIGPGRSSLVGALLEPLWSAGALAGLPLEGAWVDAGTREGFLAAAEGLVAGRWPFAPAPGSATGELVLVVDGASVDPLATLDGPAVVDAGALVGPGAVITRSVVGPGAVVGEGALVRASIIGPGAVVEPGAVVSDALVAAVR